jgi:hypothetical protein
MKRCKGIFGVHRFEGRFDREPKEGIKFTDIEIRGEASRALFEAQTVSKTYVRDICVRCGETIERIRKSDAS